jgi:mevalonate kinase
MTEETSAYDRERITHINYLMDNIHDSTTQIYESLIDRDFDNLKEHINILQTILKDISISVEDDI